MKRKISLILLFTTLLTTALSCSDTPSQSTDTTVSGGTTAQPVDTKELSFFDAHAAAQDDLPEADFGGEEFLIGINTYCETGFYTEETTGESLSDAIYDRNKAVEDRFNVKLVFDSQDWQAMASDVLRSVTAGDDTYQLLCEHTIEANKWVMGEVLYNLHDIPYINFDQPWWSPSNTECLTYNGKHFQAVGDFCLTTIGRTYSIYFDKVEAESYKIPDLYELVYDGKWTIDALHTYTKDIYRDLNMNNEVDTVEDFFGYTTSVASNIGAYLWSFGGMIIEDGEVVMNVEKTNDTIQKLIDVCVNSDGTCYDTTYYNSAGNRNYIGVEKLAEGTTLFASAMLESGINYLRDVDHDYGIIPYPKWDEEQEDYITIVDGGFTTMSIPKTVVNTERAGIITEALNAETYRNVIPIYYEIALKQKGARDDESIAMIDYVMSKRVYDFGYIYDNWKGFGFVIETLVQKGEATFASYYASNIEAVKAHYESVFETFDNYDQ
ncbi:MAG: hypothetical protein IJ493_06595 [Clostridia bacterium]|nr:hypothetical protein [Clostridia bacterium]